LGMGLRIVMLLIVPASIGLFVLATPIIALVFEHGAFEPYDTLRTSQALRVYLIGLPFAALEQPLIFAFYARKDTKTPVLVGVLGVVVYVVAALLLIVPLGMLGLVLANSIQLTSHALLMLYLAHRRFDALRNQALGRTALKVAVASLVIGAVVWAGMPGLTRLAALSSVWSELLVVAGGAAVGVLTYGVMLWILRVEDLTTLKELALAQLPSASGRVSR
jgi:putative peptidoglycan lipid II flippase